MICQDFLPGPSLREYVRCYLLRHFVFSDPDHIPFKPYAPRTEQTLAFYPRCHELVEYVANHKIIKRPHSMIMGQYTERTNRHLGNIDFLTFLVDFQPGVLFRM